MTRKSKREIERAVEDLGDDDQDDGDDPVRVVIRRDLVDDDGGVIETDEKLVEL